MTLIDGASEQVAASVSVATRAGDRVGVVQDGGSAFLTDDTSGTVTRVDGATYASLPPIAFGEPGAGVDVIPGGDRLYVLDAGRRTAHVVDPVTLQSREQLSLAARPGRGQSVVDRSGRLWVVDSGGGGLTWFDGGEKRVAAGGADSAAELVLVQGAPVLVDPVHQRVGPLTADGAVDDWSCLDVAGGDQVQVLGSESGPSVFAAVKDTGTLVRASSAGDDCQDVVEIGSPGDVFGELAQSGPFVFVPNVNQGTTYVVDTRSPTVVAAKFDVSAPGHQLELVPEGWACFLQ